MVEFSTVVTHNVVSYHITENYKFLMYLKFNSVVPTSTLSSSGI
jgi:hypothetical protein